MKTGAGLALIALGANRFAVNATPSWLNLHTVGWVLMLVGLVGLVLPERTYGWLGRRIETRRTYPATRVRPPSTPRARRHRDRRGHRAAADVRRPGGRHRRDHAQWRTGRDLPHCQRPDRSDQDLYEQPEDLYEQP